MTENGVLCLVAMVMAGWGELGVGLSSIALKA